jgi:hypothetical protein
MGCGEVEGRVYWSALPGGRFAARQTRGELHMPSPLEFTDAALSGTPLQPQNTMLLDEGHARCITSLPRQGSDLFCRLDSERLLELNPVQCGGMRVYPGMVVR